MEIAINALTDRGRKREINEDCYGFLADHRLVVVCDGMGGHNAGEVASRIAVDSIKDFFQRLRKVEIDKICFDIELNLPSNVMRLIAAIRLTNYHIYTMAGQNKGQKGMGTTAVVVYFDDDYLLTAHVGDSRIYRFSKGKLEQLTQDHSWVNELVQGGELEEKDAENFGRRNIIIRAIGINQSAKIDIIIDSVRNGDQYLLCTDGLTGSLSNEDIRQILGESETNQDAVERLIDLANERGGTDNITAALVTISQLEKDNVYIKKLQTTIANESEEVQQEKRNILERLFEKNDTDSQIQPPPSRQMWRPIIIYATLFICVIIFTVLWIIAHTGRNSPKQAESNQTNVTQKFSYQRDTTLVNKRESFINHPGLIYFINMNNKNIENIADVYVDSKIKGKLNEFNKDGLNLAIGSHKVEIHLNGNYVIVWNIEVEKNDPLYLNIDDEMYKLRKEGNFPY